MSMVFDDVRVVNLAVANDLPLDVGQIMVASAGKVDLGKERLTSLRAYFRPVVVSITFVTVA